MNLIKFVLFIGLLLGITEKGLTQEHDWKKDNLKGIVVSVKEIEYETETKFGEHIKKGIKNTNQIFYNERGIIRKKINEYTHDTYSTYYIYNEAQKLIKEITVKLDSIETMNTERMMVKVAQIDTIKINEYIYASNGKLVEINRYRRSFRDGGVSLKEKIKHSYSLTEEKILTYNADGRLTDRVIIPINVKTNSQLKKTGCQYNKYGDIMKDGNISYEYTYDNHQNWTTQKAYVYYNEEPNVRQWTEREYTYANTLEDLTNIVRKEQIEEQKQQQSAQRQQQASRMLREGTASTGAREAIKVEKGALYTLSGRSLSSFPKPLCVVQEQGRVVVNITVNPAGLVIAASINPLTNTTSTTLRNAPIKAAKKARFNTIDSMNNQQGTITYHFELR